MNLAIMRRRVKRVHRLSTAVRMKAKGTSSISDGLQAAMILAGYFDDEGNPKSRKMRLLAGQQ